MTDDFELQKTLSNQALARVEKLAWIMDDCIEIPVIRVRFGLDAVVGLIPGLGDVISGLTCLYIIFESALVGAHPSVLFRMAIYLAVELFVGSIPILGDLFDIAWKANRRSANLLKKYIHLPKTTTRTSRFWILFWAVTIASGLMALSGFMVWGLVKLVQLFTS